MGRATKGSASFGWLSERNREGPVWIRIVPPVTYRLHDAGNWRVCAHATRFAGPSVQPNQTLCFAEIHHRRATPLLWLTVDTATLKNRRNDYEYQALVRLADALPTDIRVCIVADRGFDDQKLDRVLT